MSICFKCGAVLHDEDAPKHKCNQNDIPIKGIKHINGKKIDIKTELEV